MMTHLNNPPLPIKTWTSLAKKHSELVSPIADAFLIRRKSGLTHPIHDFLFTYYYLSPLKLKQWIPSFEDSLSINAQIRDEYPWLNEYWFYLDNNRMSLNRKRLGENTCSLAKFVANLCGNILERVPRFGCFGLHEWAMVYKSTPEEIRHKGYRLRLSTKELASFVEGQMICCSHYDAYRFFTKEAAAFNILKPTLETRLQMEQGGCVHANMDLYKWATKLWPWIGSDFIAKAFFLALEGRELDMRASPYDFTDEGYEPVCVETEEGRRQYQKEQQIYAERSISLRKELKSFCERLTSLQAGQD